jgi:hypothetical protein
MGNLERILLVLIGVTVVMLFTSRIPFRVRMLFAFVVAMICSFLGFAGSLAPHRLAEARATKHGVIVNEDWREGARATGKVVFETDILLLAKIVLLTVMVFYLAAQVTKAPREIVK